MTDSIAASVAGGAGGAVEGRARDFLTSVLDALRDAAIVIDLDNRVLYWNAAATELYGVSAAEMVGKPLQSAYVYEWVCPEDEQRAWASLEREHMWRGDCVHRLRSGARLWVEATVSTVTDASGAKTGLLAVIRDVTERRTTERRLQQALTRYSVAESAAGLAAWEFDPVSRVAVWSPQAFTLFGLDADDPDYFAKWQASIVDADRERVRSAVLASAATANVTLEYRFAHPVKGIRTIRSSAGRAPGASLDSPIYGVSIDITDISSAVEELESARRRLSLALRAAHAGAWDYDLARRQVFWSPEYYDLFGISRNTPASYDAWIASVHPDDRERVHELFLRVIADRRTDFRAEYRIADAAGAMRWIASVGTVTYGEGREPTRSTGISIDITERKSEEEDRDLLLASERQARAVADEALRARDLFIATVSHELRNPVNTVLGWSHVLSTLITGGDPRIAQAVSAIERGARAQSTLIDELIDLSRATSGKLKIDPRRLDLASVINCAVDQIRPGAATRQLQLSVAVPTAAYVNADESRIQQVVLNLLSNAVKFTPPGGTIQVRLRTDSANAVLTVTDSGVGIDPHVLPRIFEPFVQGAAPARHQAGLGLGLTISRRIVELHGGTICAESNGSGLGTTVTVRLPLCAG